jgi:seryl-tRNA synthetase
MGDMREKEESNRKVNRDIDSLRRERDSIQRLINQAKLQEVNDSLEAVKSRMDAIEKILEN